MARVHEEKIESILQRNVVQVTDRNSLEAKLRSGKVLRVKLGADPTAPDLHLGHAVLLWKLKEFQELGHKIVFIIGDFTAAIGDPSGRSQTRPLLSGAEIKRNAKTYFDQVKKILDVKKIEVRRNSDWLGKLKLRDWMGILRTFTVSQILERDDFSKRLSGGQEVWLHEIMYPLLQAYDSVAVRADVELGGSDQLFNLMAGRTLLEKLGRPPQDILITEYVVGLDGEKKMSKSLGNYVGIAESDRDMFGKLMSIPDELIVPYFRLAANGPEIEIKEAEDRLKKGENPRDVKLKLAKEVTALYHGSNKAEKARAEFIRVFSKRELPEAMEETKLDEGSYEASALLLAAGGAKSKSEAWRLVTQGALEIIPRKGIAEKVSNPRALIHVSKGMVIRVGKARFFKVG